MSITYHVCKYTPVELLTALGRECALLDEAPDAFDLSDQVAHPNLCGFGKSVIQAVMAGHVKEVVLVNCCDTIRRTYDILKEFGNLDFLYLLDILHGKSGCSVDHAKHQLMDLAEAYGKYKGTQFDKAAFFAAFAPTTPRTDPHIAVIGAKMGAHLFSLVEETMPLPVENLTCASNRSVVAPEDQAEFETLMEAYARQLLGQLPCMRMTDNTARKQLFHAPGLEGVVYHTLQFCDYYGFEYAGLRNHLSVPLLKIESDGTTQSREQLRTRLDAFAEGFATQKGATTMDKHGYFAGIDSGSATTDVVILDQDKNIVAKVILPTGAGASNGALPGDDGPDAGNFLGGHFDHRPEMEGGDHHLLHVYRFCRLRGGLPGGPEQGPAGHRPRPEPVRRHPRRRPLPAHRRGAPLHDDRRCVPE